MSGTKLYDRINDGINGWEISMRKYLVGVMPLYDENKDSYWMLPGYFKMLEQHNIVPIMLPLTDKHDVLDYFVNLCDGFLFTGGHDVNPKQYKAEMSSECGIACDMRDDMEVYLLSRLKEINKPVLGICRGIQIINVAFGGTLYQDLPTEFDSCTDHHMTPPYDRTVHNVEISENGTLYSIVGKKSIGVNSYHHQAIRDISEILRIEAISEDGLIEAVSLPGKKFFLGIQWHPEFSYIGDENSKLIIKAFTDAIGG